MLLLYFLTSEYDSRKILLKESYHSDAKPSPLKKAACFPFSFYFVSFIHLSELRKNMCFVLFEYMGKEKSAVSLDVWGDSLLNLKSVMILRFIFSDFSFFTSWWAEFLPSFQFLSTRVNNIIWIAIKESVIVPDNIWYITYIVRYSFYNQFW